MGRLAPQRRNRGFALPLLPALALELGNVVLRLGPAEAEIGNKAPVGGQIQRGARRLGIEDRDPADAESFGSGCKPQPSIWPSTC